MKKNIIDIINNRKDIEYLQKNLFRALKVKPYWDPITGEVDLKAKKKE